MALETASAIDLDKAKLQLDEYGYVLLPNLIPRADALAMAERLMELSLQQGGLGRRRVPESLMRLQSPEP